MKYCVSLRDITVLVLYNYRLAAVDPDIDSYFLEGWWSWTVWVNNRFLSIAVKCVGRSTKGIRRLKCAEYQTMCLSQYKAEYCCRSTQAQMHTHSPSFPLSLSLSSTHTFSGDGHRKMLRLQLASHLLCCQGDAGTGRNPVTHFNRSLYSTVEISTENRIHAVGMNWQWKPLQGIYMHSSVISV